MFTRILVPLVVGVVGVVLYWHLGGLRGLKLPEVVTVEAEELAPALRDMTESQFSSELLGALNAAREKQGLPAMSQDAKLETWLREQSGSIDINQLEKAVNAVKMPGYSRWSVGGASGGSLRDLSRAVVEQLSESGNAEMLFLGWLVRRGADGSREVVTMQGQKLKELDLAALNSGKIDAFMSTCPHCKKQTAFRFDTGACGLMVDCPACLRRCEAVAPDGRKNYRYVQDYLERTKPPAVPPGSDALDTMMTVWQTAVNRCAYVKDPEGEDSWQTPLETLRRKAGDCEDSSLLLTDWLLSCKVQARMVLGKLNNSGHAWCVARADGSDYLLESTNRRPDIQNLPVVNTDDGYEPETLFDRDYLYVQARPGQKFDGDYWSPEKWVRVPRKNAPAARVPAAAKSAPAPLPAASGAGVQARPAAPATRAPVRAAGAVKAVRSAKAEPRPAL